MLHFRVPVCGGVVSVICLRFAVFQRAKSLGSRLSVVVAGVVVEAREEESDGDGDDNPSVSTTLEVANTCGVNTPYCSKFATSKYTPLATVGKHSETEKSYSTHTLFTAIHSHENTRHTNTQLFVHTYVSVIIFQNFFHKSNNFRNMFCYSSNHHRLSNLLANQKPEG